MFKYNFYAPKGKQIAQLIWSNAIVFVHLSVY